MQNESLPQFIHEVPARQAAERPEAICLYPENTAPMCYGDLWQATGQARDWLAGAGVQRGQRVMIVGENCPEMIVLLFACSLLGAWPVSVNARLSLREIETIAHHCEPALMFFTSGISASAARHAQALAAKDCPAFFTGANHYFVPERPGKPESGDIARRVATLVYTSGTTGAPKGVMVSHRGLLHFAGVSSASRRMTGQDIAYAALPLSHIFGLATVLMATFHAGASLVLRARFEVDDVLRSLTRPGLSILQGVPTMFVRLLSATADQKKITAPSLRYVYTGGAAMDLALKGRVEKRFGLPLHHGYGITEYAGSMFITDIDHPRNDAGVGKAVAGVEIDIRHDGGTVEQGEKGGIHIKGPGIMLGYYRNPEQTAKALLPGGWLDTGDIGYLDRDGVLFLTGRSKDIIIRSGFNVYPQEVEAVINAYEGIRISAVVGQAAEDGNEEVIAFYEPETGVQVDEAALMQHVSSAVAPYKRPARFIRIDCIPTTMSGKIQKEPLREQLRRESASC
ncbi:long-chain fatty acid--CoA ligase [Allopusillimonas soli]|uniref:Acyl--CoA ligase n=1 Tax=Allopusillimonas soli TaxID=659016 RepID=A0A853FA70_9BURK|nr:class I adenylate-forming enzyme family protein [Allopusillimonas soli]NYT35481.1 acyl--CoA ligase [Allopusillimonas soli]TEA75893.1 long-chain fatty acid--CoA ligase [Allopusillimonas soli]